MADHDIYGDILGKGLISSDLNQTFLINGDVKGKGLVSHLLNTHLINGDVLGKGLSDSTISQTHIINGSIKGKSLISHLFNNIYLDYSTGYIVVKLVASLSVNAGDRIELKNVLSERLHYCAADATLKTLIGVKISASKVRSHSNDAMINTES